MMDKPHKKIVATAVGFVFTCGLAVAGLYAGGRLFADLQKIPSDSVTIYTLIDYWKAYSHVRAVKFSLMAGWAAAIALPLIPVAMVVVSALTGKKRELHGSARFATNAEVRQAGLYGDDKAKWPGVIVGKLAGKFLVFVGQQFISVKAPTRSGKDIGIVTPNLLSYPHSIINHDIKLESYKLTAGFRALHGQEVYLFAPNHPDKTSHCFNPMSYIRREYDYRIGDIQSQASMWYPSGGKDAFWNDNAQVLFLGLSLYMMETPTEVVTMANMLSLSTPATGESLDKWIEATISAREERDSELPRLSVECVDALRSFAVNTDQVRANILSTFIAPLKIFRSPLIAAATSADDFDLRDVRRKKMTIYFGMTAEDLVTYSVLANIFYSILLNENTKTLPQDDPSLKYQCLVIFNEFTSVGRLKIIQKAIAYMAGYNMRLLLIFQNKGQIAGREDGYGPEGAQTLMTNCAMNILFQPKENEDAKEYSETLGYQTVKSRAKSRSVSAGKPGHSHNDSDQRRALMLPQEIKEIGFKKIIISVEGCKPIFADKVISYEDDAFTDRLNLTPPVVPHLTIVRAQHRTRALTVSEAETIDVEDIVNKAEILKACCEAIGLDFTGFATSDLDQDISVAA
jgi:type IV secretion system protein VirD4